MKMHNLAWLRTSAIAVGLAITTVTVDTKSANAVLNYNIFEASGNLVIETSGMLNLPASAGSISCTADGAIDPSAAIICTGTSAAIPWYPLSSGPFSIGTGPTQFADFTSGITTILAGGVFFPGPGVFLIDSSYVSGNPIISSTIFYGRTLADLGLTSTSGTVGTWTLVDTGDTINVNVVPGPLPLLGAGAAFGFSRRLRRRIKVIQPPFKG